MSAEDPKKPAETPAKPENKYEGNFPGPYLKIKATLAELVKDGNLVLDIGANNGNLEVTIDEAAKDTQVICVDLDGDLLAELRARNLQNTQIQTVCANANDFLSSTELVEEVNLGLVVATLHEINTPKAQPAYLDFFFQKLHQVLKTGGKVIIADYYYPPEVPQDELDAYLIYQKDKIGHADPREKFVPPELLKAKIVEHGFKLLSSEQMLATNDINRLFLIFIIEK